MRNLFKPRAESELLHLICTALMIEIDWFGVILSSKWSQYSNLSEAHRIGAVAAIPIGVAATAAYIRWAVRFDKTALELRKEKSYRRIRDLAWVGMMCFMLSQLFL